MKLIKPLLLLMVAGISFDALAEKIYKTVDKSGAVVFSDQKTPDAEKIIVKPNVVDVKIPDMPEPYVRKKPEKNTTAGPNAVQQEEVGRGTATAGNLKRKIRNVTNGEGVNRPVNLPARGRPAAGGGAGGGGARGGSR